MKNADGTSSLFLHAGDLEHSITNKPVTDFNNIGLKIDF